MAVNLSIKNVPDDLAAAVRERAQRNHRSMQGELMAMLETHARPVAFDASTLMRRVRSLGLRTAADSTKIVRRRRDTR